MALVPSRPDGSQHFNRFFGDIVEAVSAESTPSGEVPNGSTIPGVVQVRFGPLDVPRHVFDDAGTPPGSAPQDGVGPHGPVKDRTWAKNAKIAVKALDANTTHSELDPVEWEIDPTTGMPILVLLMTFTALPAKVDVQVTIPHSVIR